MIRSFVAIMVFAGLVAVAAVYAAWMGMMALHEAGHVVTGIIACPADRLHKVTIEARGRSLGAALLLAVRPGGAFGTALFGAILSTRLGMHLGDATREAPPAAISALEGQDLHAVAENVQLINALPEPLHGLVTEAFSLALHDVFLAAVPLTLLALVAALFLKEVPLAERDPAQTSSSTPGSNAGSPSAADSTGSPTSV